VTLLVDGGVLRDLSWTNEGVELSPINADECYAGGDSGAL